MLEKPKEVFWSLKWIEKYVFVEDLLLPFGWRTKRKKEQGWFSFAKWKDSLRPIEMLLNYVWLYLECQSIHKVPWYPPCSLKGRSPPDFSERLRTPEIGGHSSLLQKGRKILIIAWKNSARGVLQPPATLVFNDYSKSVKHKYDFSILFIFKNQVLVDPSAFKSVLKNRTLQRLFFSN